MKRLSIRLTFSVFIQLKSTLFKEEQFSNRLRISSIFLELAKKFRSTLSKEELLLNINDISVSSDQFRFSIPTIVFKFGKPANSSDVFLTG